VTIYICAVSGQFPENYEIGIRAGVWGVEEKYKRKIAPVQSGDTLVFLVGGDYRSIHKIESAMFEEKTALWPRKNGSLFPYRVRISSPIRIGYVSAKSLAASISFMKGKEQWGGTIQGPNGVFNDKLNADDLRLIESTMKSSPPVAPKPDPAVVRRAADKETALLKFYEGDVESRVINSLDRLNLRLYVDPKSGKTGKQFAIDGGRIDLLCEDLESDGLAVVELKKGEAPDQALLQVLRYMSWVRQHLAGSKTVRGIILAESTDATLSKVVGEVPNVSIRHYRVSIDILPS